MIKIWDQVKRYLAILFSLCSMARLACADEVIWKGKAAGYEIRWSTASITVVRAADRALILSTGDLANVNPSKLSEVEEGLEEQMECEGGESFALLSVVGDLVTISESLFDVCVGAAHPYVYRIWIPIDLQERESNRLVDVRRDGTNEERDSAALTDLFPRDDVLDALRSDPYVRKALRETQTPAPDDLTGLVAALASRAGCEFGFDEDMLSRFAFHHLEGDKVAVRLGISNQSAYACNKGITEVGLLLPIPDALRAPLHDADTRKSGFLMKDLNRIAGKKTAGFKYETAGPIFIREQVHPDLPDYYFSVLGKFSADGKIAVKKIRVGEATDEDVQEQYANELQMLDVIKKMKPLARDAVHLFVEDLNFDGYQDLGLETAETKATAYNDYWLFDPKSGNFEYLGNYPTLTPDPEDKVLTYSDLDVEKICRIQNGKLVLLHEKRAE